MLRSTIVAELRALWEDATDDHFAELIAQAADMLEQDYSDVYALGGPQLKTNTIVALLHIIADERIVQPDDVQTLREAAERLQQYEDALFADVHGH